MKRNVLKLTLLFALCTNGIFAQNISSNETSAKNVIYVSAGSAFFYNAVDVNYDMRIKQAEKGFFKNYYATLDAGFFNLNSGFSPGSVSNGFKTGIGIAGLTGKGSRHFETSLGLSFNIETEVYNDRNASKKDVIVFPELALGYRYQKANEFIFRVGVGFPQLIYIGFGYGF